MRVEIEELEQCAWQALKQQALSKEAEDLNNNFSANSLAKDSLYTLTGENLIAHQTIAPPSVEEIRRGHSSGVSSAVRSVFYSAISLGLIVPGKLGQAYDWSASYGAYQFTERGIDFFRKGEIALDIPSLLTNRIREIASQYQISNAVVALTGEAQKCWASGCTRAAMVLIGLVVEDACIDLLDALGNYPNITSKPHSKPHQDWMKLQDDKVAFYTRWRPGIQVLEIIKDGLNKGYGKQKPDWWAMWESVPGGIEPYGQAVRFARNKAAHDVDRIFSNAEIGLLLASLPTMLAVIGQLKEFIITPPSGVTLPPI
jgi:hypothetical protein